MSHIYSMINYFDHRAPGTPREDPVPRLIELEFKHNFYLYGERDLETALKSKSVRVYYLKDGAIQSGDPQYLKATTEVLTAAGMAVMSRGSASTGKKDFNFKDYGRLWFIEKIPNI